MQQSGPPFSGLGVLIPRLLRRKYWPVGCTHILELLVLPPRGMFHYSPPVTGRKVHPEPLTAIVELSLTPCA